MSDSVLKPDIFSTSFLVVDNPNQALPEPQLSESDQRTVSDNNYGYLVIVGGAIILGIILYIKAKKNSRRKTESILFL